MWILDVIVLFIMLLGVCLSFIPGMPSTSLIFICASIHQYYLDAPDWYIIAVLGILAGIAFWYDYAATMQEVKKRKASKKSMIGAVLGAIVGTFMLPIIGTLIGTFLGAVVGEIFSRLNPSHLFNVGFGAMAGATKGMFITIRCAIAMFFVYFVYLVFV